MTDDIVLKLKVRAARLARLVEVNAPIKFIEAEFWLVTESFITLRAARRKRELDQYEIELRSTAKRNAIQKHESRFPHNNPWAECRAEYHRNNLINAELADMLGVPVHELEEWEKTV